MRRQPTTLYWHDYETFGADPKRDRPVQFAGVRTDLELNLIGEPLTLFARPTPDVLPQPEACLVTGITPQQALEQGVPETEFMARILEELGRPGTCGLGYNSIRFDDEVTRYALYRNLYDPYEREWRNGNSRWDLIDVVRMTYALRPEGIEWPRHEDGRPSFRLEELSVANGIEHGAAHDALSDVYATIELARLIRSRQPRLFDYAFNQRSKRVVGEHLDLEQQRPVIHVSSRYPSERGCLAMVMPLAPHPTNKNGVLVYDLSVDPTPLLELDADSLRERIFTATADLPEGVERIALKQVHLNKAPMLVPLNTLRPADAERLGIDREACERNWNTLRQASGLGKKIAAVFSENPFAPEQDPDYQLYGGGFFSDRDRDLMTQVHRLDPQQLGQQRFDFEDPRLPELLFRFRARNYPETLASAEMERWLAHCADKLETEGQGNLTFAQLGERLQQLQAEWAEDERAQRILAAVGEFAGELAASLQA